MDTHLRTAHKVARIRGPRIPASPPGRRRGELTAARDSDADHPQARRLSLAMTLATSPGAAAPSVILACPRADSSGRIQMTAIARALEWPSSGDLPVTLRPAEQTLVVGQSGPAHLTTTCRLDAAGRLRLSTSARSVLGMHAGVTQLVVAADPDTGTAVIRPGHVAAALLTQEASTTPQLAVNCG